ncbi:MAG: hypothetical protein IKS90_02510 [Clostridia bacterium]|nr:hypothetical protein [Clostridia bacterium]
MRIYVKADDMKLPIVMAVPTGAIGWRWIWRIINKNAKGDKAPIISEETAQKLAAAVKRYVRQNGHFYLVDITSADGDRVRIRL